MSAVLRCPHCGERVKKEDNFCSHCGKEFDKAHIDDISTAYHEGVEILCTLIALFVVWFVIALILSLICHAFNLTPDAVLPAKISIGLTLFLFVVYKLGK